MDLNMYYVKRDTSVIWVKYREKLFKAVTSSTKDVDTTDVFVRVAQRP